MNRPLLIGTLPPPANGQATAFAMLVGGLAARSVRFDVVDIAERGRSGEERADGAFSMHRVASLVKPLLRAARLLVLGRRRTLYLTVAQSWNGFLRDEAFVRIAAVGGRRHRVVLHLFGGNYRGFHDALPPAGQRRVQKLLRRADALVVEGEALRTAFTAVPGVDPDRVHVVHNALDIDEAALPDAPRPLEPDREIRLLFLSNLLETKGYLDVLDAVATLVHDHGLPVRADFCGAFLLAADTTLYATTGEAEADFAARVERLRLTDHVIWHGVVGADRREAMLRDAHAFVLPTRYVNEGQPLSVVEAMAFGCVPLVTDYRSLPELIDGGRVGRFVSAGEPDTIVSAVRALAASPAEYARIARAAMDWRRQTFGRDRFVDGVLALLNDAR